MANDLVVGDEPCSYYSFDGYFIFLLEVQNFLPLEKVTIKAANLHVVLNHLIYFHSYTFVFSQESCRSLTLPFG